MCIRDRPKPCSEEEEDLSVVVIGGGWFSFTVFWLIENFRHQWNNWKNLFTILCLEPSQNSSRFNAFCGETVDYDAMHDGRAYPLLSNCTTDKIGNLHYKSSRGWLQTPPSFIYIWSTFVYMSVVTKYFIHIPDVTKMCTYKKWQLFFYIVSSRHMKI